MTKKLTWRLAKLPTPEEIRGLLSDKVLTKEEAREILFSSETEESRDKKSLESEIKFLRELVEKLSKNSTNIVETIRYIEKPYYHSPWYKSYDVWCGTLSSGASGINTDTVLCSSGTGLASQYTDTASFSDIKTF